MEGEDSLRTLECLKGRLLAERVASRVAKEEAEQMGNKVIELETLLRAEIKSRNKAEKKLKFLTKKLESMNIFYVCDELEHSSLLEKTENSYVTSTASSSTKGPEDKEPISQITNSTQCDIEEPMEKTESPVVLKNLKYNVSPSSTSGQSYSSPSNEETLSFTDKADSENSNEVNSEQNYHDSKTCDHSSKSSIEVEDVNGENDQKEDDYVDNSFALVPLDLPETTPIIDPETLDATVKDVLDALRHAKEKLQSSMERRHMITVGLR